MIVVLAVCLGGLAASGHFPREHREPVLRSAAGSAILYGSIAVAALSLAFAVSAAWRSIPWYAAIIGGGMVLLATPLLLRPLPDAFVNGRGALILFAGIAGVAAIAIVSIG
jgi:hypothetical protein